MIYVRISIYQALKHPWKKSGMPERSLVPQPPSCTRARKGRSGQKDYTNASGWNVIIGNSGVQLTTTSAIRTVPIPYRPSACARTYRRRTTHN